jgi:chromate transporter
LFTSATFIGYLFGGVPAALIATLGIFLPSYIFVAISNPIIPKLRESPWAGSLLDGVIVASLGLMAAVTFQLGQASLVDLPTLIIFALSAFLLFRYKVNTTWLIMGGALFGFIVSLLR